MFVKKMKNISLLYYRNIFFYIFSFSFLWNELYLIHQSI